MREWTPPPWHKVRCAYCNNRPAVNRDHVIPKATRKHGAAIPAELLLTVPACFECNMRKGTRKLVPPSWKDKIGALKEAIPGQWRVWDGDPMSPAFREVHLKTEEPR